MDLVQIGGIQMKTNLICSKLFFFLFVQENKAIPNHFLNVWEILEEALFSGYHQKQTMNMKKVKILLSVLELFLGGLKNL